MDEDRHVIAAAGMTATVTADGAELVSLRAPNGAELIWQAGPAWPRHAPILFPIVGRLKADTLRHRGQDYRLTQHGFARGPAVCVAGSRPDRVPAGAGGR